jgi:sulfatase maturation enzyme AslB (radical SAM superfamily)
MKITDETPSRGVQNLVKNRIPDLNSLTLPWFGREPLAAFDGIEEISSSTQFF